MKKRWDNAIFYAKLPSLSGAQRKRLWQLGDVYFNVPLRIGLDTMPLEYLIVRDQHNQDIRARIAREKEEQRRKEQMARLADRSVLPIVELLACLLACLLGGWLTLWVDLTMFVGGVARYPGLLPRPFTFRGVDMRVYFCLFVCVDMASHEQSPWHRQRSCVRYPTAVQRQAQSHRPLGRKSPAPTGKIRSNAWLSVLP